MTALIVVETVVLVLLVVVVTGLLRSHGEILRRLHTLGAGLDPDGVDRLLCLSTDAELDWAGVPELGSRAEAFGLNYRWLPVPDQGTCSLSEAIDLVGWCRDGLKRGESVVVTCMGGLGRSGMIAACTLVDAGVSPTAAIASVRAARGPRALETSGQEDLVSRFAAS